MQNISLIGTVVLGKKSFERFFTIYGHGGHLEFRIIYVTRSAILVLVVVQRHLQKT